MYIIEWIRDFELIEREISKAGSVSEAIAEARANWSQVFAGLGRKPDRFRVKNNRLKELAVVALPKPR
ncbi:MAG TPA: hypothetical protein VKV96_17190 [Roseiarcus sp.]|nr:hypothetical protein [Roseiarcus sp.]